MIVWLVNIGENFWLREKSGITQPLCAPVPGVPAVVGAKICTNCFDSIGNLISCVLPNIYVVSGVIFFVLMIIGGIGVIRGAGSGNEEDLKKGQKAITSALLGFLIIFVSYWIIQLVQIITGTEIFNNPSL